MASDIRGKGYGDTHDWERLPHVDWIDWVDAVSDYKCRTCGRNFPHWYHTQSNIFKAMENCNVGICPNSRIANSE